jgi:hypothetical protein
MSNVNELREELRVMINDTATPVASRAAQITDDLSLRYADLFQNDPSVQPIGQMAAKIKASRATEGENGVMWAEVIHLVHQLLDS